MQGKGQEDNIRCFLKQRCTSVRLHSFIWTIRIKYNIMVHVISAIKAIKYTTNHGTFGPKHSCYRLLAQELVQLLIHLGIAGRKLGFWKRTLKVAQKRFKRYLN